MPVSGAAGKGGTCPEARLPSLPLSLPAQLLLLEALPCRRLQVPLCTSWRLPSLHKVRGWFCISPVLTPDPARLPRASPLQSHTPDPPPRGAQTPDPDPPPQQSPLPSRLSCLPGARPPVAACPSRLSPRPEVPCSLADRCEGGTDGNQQQPRGTGECLFPPEQTNVWPTSVSTEN